MIKSNEDYIILKVDRDLLERLRMLSGESYPKIETELSNFINLQMGELLRRLAMDKKVTITCLTKNKTYR